MKIFIFAAWQGGIKIDNKTKHKLYLEISKYSLDVSKLIVGGVILSGIMRLSIDKNALIVFGVIAALLSGLFGLLMFVLGNKNNKK